ncbi:hypothetical protein ACVOMT_24035 (plasmid) [Sphingomonas panni]
MIDILGHELLNGLSPIVSLADSAVTAAQQGDAMLGEILATLSRRVEGLEGFTRAYRELARLPDPVAAPVALDALAGDLARLFGGASATGWRCRSRRAAPRPSTATRWCRRSGRCCRTARRRRWPPLPRPASPCRSRVATD